MNWEALAIIGGSAVVLLLIVSPLAVWWHRRKADPSRPKEASLTVTGVIVVGGMVGAMLVGAIFREVALANVPRWGRAVLIPAYFLGLILLFAWVGSILERHGYPISRRGSGAA